MPTPTSALSRRLLVVFVAILFGLSACGDDATVAGDPASPSAEETSQEESGADTESEADAFPITIESDAGSFTLDQAPQRVVSLSPMATEVLFAIGAGSQVVAVDDFSTYPADAPTTDLSGWNPNSEAVLSYEPDLVVIANDANNLVADLTAAGVPVLISAAPEDLETGYDEIANLGLVTGQTEGATATADELRDELEAAFAESPDVSVRVYHELGAELFSASSNGFVGAVYTGVGLENIADAADVDGSGYPQLSEEYIIEADPELIVITDMAPYSPEELAARAGWDQVSAVRNGNVVVVSADPASRWGPRLPLFVREVNKALADLTIDG